MGNASRLALAAVLALSIAHTAHGQRTGPGITIHSGVAESMFRAGGYAPHLELQLGSTTDLSPLVFSVFGAFTGDHFTTIEGGCERCYFQIDPYPMRTEYRSWGAGVRWEAYPIGDLLGLSAGVGRYFEELTRTYDTTREQYGDWLTLAEIGLHGAFQIAGPMHAVAGLRQGFVMERHLRLNTRNDRRRLVTLGIQYRY